MVRPLEVLTLSNVSAPLQCTHDQENVYPKGPSIQFYKLFLDTEVSKQLEMYDALAIIESDVTIAHESSFEQLFKVGSNGWFLYSWFDNASRENEMETGALVGAGLLIYCISHKRRDEVYWGGGDTFGRVCGVSQPGLLSTYLSIHIPTPSRWLKPPRFVFTHGETRQE